MNPIRTLTATLLLTFAALALAAPPVNINTAGAEALAEAISGVGLKKAQDIIRYRDTHGPFASVDELVKVQGIGERTLERSRQRLTVEP